MTRLSKGVIAAAAAVAFVALGYSAGAQEKKTTTPAAQAAAKPKSKCNAITEEATCRADTTCIWIAALVDAKTSKQKRKAYCKTKSVPKKATETVKEPKKK